MFCASSMFSGAGDVKLCFQNCAHGVLLKQCAWYSWRSQVICTKFGRPFATEKLYLDFGLCHTGCNVTIAECQSAICWRHTRSPACRWHKSTRGAVH